MCPPPMFTLTLLDQGLDDGFEYFPFFKNYRNKVSLLINSVLNVTAAMVQIPCLVCRYIKIYINAVAAL